MLNKVFCIILIFLLLFVQVIRCREKRAGAEERCITRRSKILSSINYYERCAALSYTILEPLYSDSGFLYGPLFESRNTVYRAVELVAAFRGHKRAKFTNITKSTDEHTDDYYNRLTITFYDIYDKINHQGLELRALRNQTIQINPRNIHCNSSSRDHEECLWNALSRLNGIYERTKQLGEEACDLVNNGQSYTMAHAGYIYNTFASECRSMVQSLFNKYKITNKEVVYYEYAQTQSLYNLTVNDYLLYSQPNEIQLIDSLYNKLHKLEILMTTIPDTLSKTTEANKRQALTELREGVNATYFQQENFISSSLKQVIDFNYSGRIHDATIGIPVEYDMRLDSADLFTWAEGVRKIIGSAIGRVNQLYNDMFLNFPSDKPWYVIMDALDKYIQQAVSIFPVNSSVYAGLVCFKNCDYTTRTAQEIKQTYKVCSVIVMS